MNALMLVLIEVLSLPIDRLYLVPSSALVRFSTTPGIRSATALLLEVRSKPSTRTSASLAATVSVNPVLPLAG
ncbi:hypothetical protein D3C81_1880630 [compost metagenome]